MKKLIQRAFAVMAALLMTLAVVRPALADGTGQIVVADAGSETYTAYKIFDASDASGNVTYTIAANSPWLGLVYDADANKSKVTGLEFTGPTDGKYAIEQVIGFDAAEFAKYLKNNIPSGSAAISFTGNATNDTASTGANLDPGYYLVVSSTDAGQSYQERAMLTTVLDGIATIQNKNDMPLDKTYKVNGATDPFKESDAKIGDVLHFEITGEVPNTTEYRSYIYILSDTMDAGLTFNNDLAVVITETDGSTTTTIARITPAVVTDANSQLAGNEVRYNANGLTFELSLDLLDLGKDHAGAKISVTYTATVNENAASKVSENKAVLTYSNNPSNPTSFATKDTETKTYTSRIIVDKFESGAPEQKLAGAVFRLYKIAPTGGSGQEPGVSKNADGTIPAGNSMWYYIATLTNGTSGEVTNVTWTTTADDASTKTTQSDGSARFAGIKDGVYYLEEVSAPSGYARLTEPIEIVVNGSSSTTEGLTADQVAYSLTKVASVSNTPDSLLPSTGGMGTTLFYAVSAVLLVIIVKRFARNDQSQTA